jgi:DNA-binding NarL/FixJ family response regulator
MRRKVQLFLADDSEVVRASNCPVVATVCEDVQVIGQARDYGEPIRILDVSKADIVLMDMNMPSEAAVEPEVLKLHLGDRCLVVMSAWFDGATEKRARECGAIEFLEKTK